MSRSSITDGDVVRTFALYERTVSALLDVLRRDAGDHEFTDPAPAPAPAEIADEVPGRGRIEARARRALAALANAALPDPLTWPARSLDDRCDWWVSRISNVAALLPAAPHALGVVADRIPGTAVLGATVSGMAVLAVAGEYGVSDRAARVALLSAVLTDRSPDAATIGAITADRVRLDARLAELVRLDEVRAAHGVRRLWLVAVTLRRLTTVIDDVEGVLDDRPRGGIAARAMSKLPAVGVVGSYLAERKAISRAAAKTRKKLNSVM